VSVALSSAFKDERTLMLAEAKSKPAKFAMPNGESTDYALVKRALEAISENYRDQPELEELAAALGVASVQLTRTFQRWCGLTPKGFLQAVTLDHARRMLDGGLPLLDTALELGLSGPGRLHDLFVTHEAMSPGEWKGRAAGLTIEWGFHESLFGTALVMITSRGLCGLAFADDEAAGASDGILNKSGRTGLYSRKAALADMMRRWPDAHYSENLATTAPYAARAFNAAEWRADQPLRVVLIGTDFEVRVWEGLLDIPLGRLNTYSALASKIGKPDASRAVGTAVGKNPISFVVPCHRVIGKSGALTGYHWGLTRKKAMLGWEAAITTTS
jgi:AraC family transcriptional regulator, regulatory protein of adaptative response / methylated-DNA-[protein]-cysteine methyltransferase